MKMIRMDSMVTAMVALLGLLCSALAWAAPTPFVALPAASKASLVNMEPLLSWFRGEFSNAEQAGHDPRFANATLRLKEIWPGGARVRWVYAEQSLAERPERPFRQRIYRFSAGPQGRVLMSELTMPRASDFAGAWRDPTLLAGLTPSQLSLRGGCDIWLHRQPSGDYQGRSDIGLCPTDFGGAATLVQYVWIGKDRIRLLDRAYDEEGHRRWGSPGEGYLYLRLPTAD